MKKKVVLMLLSGILSVSMLGCSNTAPSENSKNQEESFKSEVASQYDFYDDSVAVLKKEMNINAEQADAIFQILLSVGMDEKITYCYDEDAFFKVWWGSNSVDMYTNDDGSVEKILDGSNQLYPADNSEAKTDSRPEVTAEAGSSARVDQILLQAKYDAENVTDEEADKKWQESFDYLKSHKDNFYEDNEVMEQSMYYGEYIYRYIEANTPANDVSELQDSTRAAYDAGYNTVKAIKYVYRGEESQDSESTINALTKAKENLDKFK